MHRTNYASHLRTALLPLTLAAVAIGAPLASQAAAIGGVTIESVSSEWNGAPDLRAVNVVNGGGLDSALDPAGHAATYTAGYHWETMPYLSSASITFDLEGTYDVGSFRVWNFNLSINSVGDYTGRGMKDLEILTSADGTDWTSRGGFQFAPADGTATYQGQLFEGLDWDGVRFVWLKDATSWGYGDAGGHIGLSEVRFYEAPVATPVPGALVLLASSLVGLVGVGRRG